jgi:hypothetical protein
MKKITFGAVLLALIFAANVFAQPTWTPQTSPINSDLNSAWAVSSDVCWMCGPAGTSNSVVVRTTNGGTTWSLVSSSMLGLNDLYDLYAFDENKCVVGAGDGAIWSTTNGGTNWILDTMSTAAVFINVVHFFDDNNGFAQGDPVGNVWRYYITTDGGFHWTLGANAPSSVGTEAGWNNSYFALDSGHIWWGTNVSKIWKGSFRGPYNSHPTSGSLPYSFGVAFNDENTGIACMSNGSLAGGPINMSTNGGTSWSTGSFSTGSQAGFGLKVIPGTGYMWLATGNSTGTAGTVYRSINSGTSFTSQLTLPYDVYCISMANINVGWCGTAGGHIYKYTDNVSVSNQNQTPTQFTLKQNYPNPFNPQTTIDFSLAKTGYITLKVYNLLGQAVMTLVDGVETAGDHSVMFNAENLPSGTYFYTMKSGDFTATKSLVLVK